MTEHQLHKLLLAHSPLTAKSAYRKFCGEKIGEGYTREVFLFKQDPAYVVKMEWDPSYFQNIKEYLVWQEVSWVPKLSKWFAPCVFANGTGTVLIQRRTEPGAPKEYPRQLPRFFTDLKRSNYGFYEGHLVCHDYASGLLLSQSLDERTLRGVRWRKE